MKRYRILLKSGVWVMFGNTEAEAVSKAQENAKATGQDYTYIKSSEVDEKKAGRTFYKGKLQK